MGSANNPVIDIFLSSHYLSAWYCTDIVRRNSVMVTHGIVRLNNISVRSDVLYRGKLGYGSQEYPIKTDQRIPYSDLLRKSLLRLLNSEHANPSLFTNACDLLLAQDEEE